MTVSILILLLFLAIAALMFLRKLPAIMALPILAMGIGLIEFFAGHLSFEDILVVIVDNGSQRLIEPIVITIFGGTISVLLQKSGVAENLVKVGAELAGSSPFAISVVILAVVGLLFTTITGLGAVIMIATVVLPILASVGVQKKMAGGILLIGISLGGLLNVNNWAVYKNVLSINPQDISNYAMVLFLVQIPIAVIFIVVELWRTRAMQFNFLKILKFILVLAGFALLGSYIYYAFQSMDKKALHTSIRLIVSIAGSAVIPFILYDRIAALRNRLAEEVRWYSYLIPLAPLVLILVFHVQYIAAFMLGFLYSILATFRRGSMQLATRSVIEGVQSVAPVIVLLIEIGMLLSAILGPSNNGVGANLYSSSSGQLTSTSVREWPVLTDMKPLLQLIVPHSFWQYILGFGLLAPLALYRGPMNVWGLGYGVAGILLSTGQLAAASIMGVLMSLSIVQGISDPTNTHNVWLANELRVDVNSLMWKTLPYAWVTAIFGLIIAAMRFM